MSDRDSLETLVARVRIGYGSTPGSCGDDVRELCAAVERLLAEPSHTNTQAWYWALKYRQAAEALATRDRELAESRDANTG